MSWTTKKVMQFEALSQPNVFISFLFFFFYIRSNLSIREMDTHPHNRRGMRAQISPTWNSSTKITLLDFIQVIISNITNLPLLLSVEFLCATHSRASVIFTDSKTMSGLLAAHLVANHMNTCIHA